MPAIDFAHTPLLITKHEFDAFEPVVKKEKETVPWQIRHAFKGHCITWVLLISILVGAFISGILIVLPLVDRAKDVALQAEDLMRLVEVDVLNETAKVSAMIDQFSYDYNKLLVDFRSALTDVQQQINVITKEVTSVELQQQINEGFDTIGNLIPTLIPPSCLDVCTALTSTCAADLNTAESFCQCRVGYIGDGDNSDRGCDFCAAGTDYVYDPHAKNYVCIPCAPGTFKSEVGHVFTIENTLCLSFLSRRPKDSFGNWVNSPIRYSFLLDTENKPRYFNDRPVYKSDDVWGDTTYIYYYTQSPVSGQQTNKWLINNVFRPETQEGLEEMRARYAHSAGNSQSLPSFGWYEYCDGEMKKSGLKFEETGCQACPDDQLSLPGSDSEDDCTNQLQTS